MNILRVFLNVCYKPHAKKRTLVMRTREMLLRDANEGTRYLQRRLANLEGLS